MEGKGQVANRMHVTAALQKLVDGIEISASAAIVIEAAKHLPVLGTSLHVAKLSGGDSVTGVSPGHGNVSVNDDQERWSEKKIGSEPERVGSYRLWRQNQGAIRFCHFWGYDITTQGDDDMPIQYVIGHDGPTFKFFGAEDEISYRRMWCLMIQRRNLRVRVGSAPLAWPPSVIVGIAV